MSQDVVIDLVRDGLMTVIMVAAPPLLMGLIVGVAVSIFQTITSIQEPTLAFVPKILAVLLGLILFGPYMLSTLNDYFTSLIRRIPDLLVPR